MADHRAKFQSLLHLPLWVLCSWLAMGAMVSLVLLFLLAKWSVSSVFQVSAESEYIEGRIDILNNKNSTHLQWLLHRSTFRAKDKNGDNVVIEAPRGILYVGGPAHFKAERISDGRLRLALSETDNTTDGYLVYLERTGKTKDRLYPPVYVTIDDTASLAVSGNAISLPLQAMNVIIGREPLIQARRPQPILRSGEVLVLGRTALQGQLYIAKSSQLRGGDVVTATGNDEAFKVLVRVDERPALQIDARVEGEQLAISGFYTSPRFEKLTIFNMLANDRILASAGTLMGLGIALMGAIVTVRPVAAAKNVLNRRAEVGDPPERRLPVEPQEQAPEALHVSESESELSALAMSAEPDAVEAKKSYEA